ncbi:MAG: alpha/beta hydrolase [Chloroflexota bacterium]|nr:alpha/beta hydrolase [Chloroflexota bacterium]MDE2893824.1 alpha/beta hydrolase [Chloroflexota bacterium]
MSNLRESRLTINGVAGIVTAAGESDSEEAVVCLHSVPGSGRDFQWLLPETEQLVRSVAFDLPGFGRADKPRDFPYSIEGYQQWLAPAISELGIRRAHLVLHSFHSQTGLMWAAMNPDKCASVTLLAGGVLENYPGNWIANLWKTRFAGEFLQATTTRPVFKLVMQRGNWRALPGQWLDDLITEDDRDTRRVTLQLYRATNFDDGHILREALAPRDLPALVIWGRKDPFISWRYAERQRETFSNAEVHVWDDCGHLPHVQHPQRTAEKVTAFLKTVVGSDG